MTPHTLAVARCCALSAPPAVRGNPRPSRGRPHLRQPSRLRSIGARPGSHRRHRPAWIGPARLDRDSGGVPCRGHETGPREKCAALRRDQRHSEPNWWRTDAWSRPLATGLLRAVITGLAVTLSLLTRGPWVTRCSGQTSQARPPRGHLCPTEPRSPARDTPYSTPAIKGNTPESVRSCVRYLV